MKRLILIFPIFLMAGTCSPDVEYVDAVREVPAELLTPVPITDRKAETWRDLAALAVEHRNSAEAANEKIASLAVILGPQ